MGQKRVTRMDRISNLPVEIINAILVLLPLKDAVRTSILSSKWKDKWVTLSELRFFTENILSDQYLLFGDDYLQKNRMVTIVDQVLLLHQGPLRKFIICCFLPCNSPFLPYNSPIDRWIIHVSRKGVKEISINALIESCNESLYYKVSSRLFDCQEITSLDLSYCVVKLPPSFEVFPNLKSLSLDQVVWDKCDINMMTSKCPLLERLIFYASSVAFIKINHPNLEFLDISGEIATIHFESAPLLSEMSFDTCVSGWITVVSVYSILQSIFQLPNIRKLNLRDTIPLSSPLCRELKMPPFALCNLENLSMDIHFEDRNNILALLCLLRTSSSLLKLDLRGGYKYKDSPVAAGCFKAWKDFNCKLNKLVEVSITRVSDLATALEFIEVVLANSPVLQKLTISNRCKDVSISKKVLQFQRASPKAKLTISDRYKDVSISKKVLQFQRASQKAKIFWI